MVRAAVFGVLGVLAVWGVSLGAWSSTALAGLWMLLLARATRPRLQAGMALLVVVVGIPEVLWCVDGLGARARAGELQIRDKVGVYGFNLLFGGAAVAAGFPAFGRETVALGVPWSMAGTCPPATVARYGSHLDPLGTPRLRRWASTMPMRSPRIRDVVRAWAASLPEEAADPHVFDRVRIPQWHSSSYVAPSAANQVAIALNTPTTGLSAVAVGVDGRWRLDVVVDLALAYPEESTLDLGFFALEEGMFHDARPLLEPYCLEYTWSVWADDPQLARAGAVRGPVERVSTGILRGLGARYR